ncbi:putative Cytochrome P450 [Seiridium cardinale]|uniref:Cytochrome P450 n=1 Tax=Seiridium cardinale TaxID=138064 RepID=A0ABR2XQS6_9PEZI
MLPKAQSDRADLVGQRMILYLQNHATMSSLFVLIGFVWAIWRCWRFTIYPKFHPDEPRELPYLIPSKQYFATTSGPFALTAFNHTFYVVTDAKQSAEVYKNTDSLSFEEFVQTLMRTNGNDEDTIKTIYSSLPSDKPGFPNPEGLSLGRKARDWINRQLDLSLLVREPPFSNPGSPIGIQLPLYEWTFYFFVRLGQYVYFGDALDRVNPNYASDYIVFDEVIWKMLYQYPKFLCRDMIVPRDQMMASLKSYFQIPQNQRRDQAAWIINAMEDEMRALGVDDENLAIVVFHLYFAINTNARKTSFWMLTHLMRNPAYLTAFREETAPAFRGDELVNISYIQDATKCPQVDAIWHETLRLAGWAASVRLVTRDVVVGEKLMRKGNRVMVPHRLLHFDEGIFGDDIANWRPQRWTNTEAGRKLPNSPSWRPFGGGKTKCSGRYLAKYFVTAFVATLLRRFDIEMVGNPPMPLADVGRPVLGIISVKEGYDYLVSVTKRKEADVNNYM